MRILHYLDRQSRWSLVVLGLALAAALGVIDYLTGPELSFSIFYLVPISMTAWLVGRRMGFLISGVSAVLWLVADLLAEYPYSHQAIPYWNATVRFALFLIVVQMLSSLQVSRKRQEELAQFVVHDLRSPLSNVVTGLQTLQEIADETMDAAQKNLIQAGLVSCNRMLTLINSLLDLAQLESGGMPLRRDRVGVQELVVSSLDQVSVWAQRNRVALEVRVAEQGETVYADAGVTVRILVSLVSNAIKSSPPGSTVMVRVGPYSQNMAVFSVTDRGYGIPKEWVGRVFDKYVQVDARRMGKAAGSGLGLTFCQLAVEAQGGHIWLESEEGKGTTVSFTLPAGDS
jgi:signal transduction histidine kinase